MKNVAAGDRDYTATLRWSQNIYSACGLGGTAFVCTDTWTYDNVTHKVKANER